jgi:anti-anti-sigma factor
VDPLERSEVEMTEQAPGQCQRSRALEILKLGQLTVSSEREGDVHRISLAGELDLATVHAAEHELERVEATDALSIVVDLRGLAFIDSTGVRIAGQAQARVRGPRNVCSRSG